MSPCHFTCGGDASSLDNGLEGQDVVLDEGVSVSQTPSGDFASISRSVPDPRDQSSSPVSEDSPATSGFGKLVDKFGKLTNKAARKAPYSKGSRYSNLPLVVSDRPQPGQLP